MVYYFASMPALIWNMTKHSLWQLKGCRYADATSGNCVGVTADMTVVAPDHQYQFLLLQSEQHKSKALYIAKLVSTELKVPLCECKDQLIDVACLARIESELIMESHPQPRKRLMLAGRFLEEQITICALHTLALGFEVFLLKDFVEAKNPHHILAHDMRLYQAGVVPTTLRQLLYEWLSVEEVLERRALKRSLLEMIERRG